jgi:hypothetical protein
MSLTLSRFSQEVDVGSDDMAVAYFAIFKSEDGRELKLPISQEASQTIITFFADKTKVAKPVEGMQYDTVVAREDHPREATTFGDDEQAEEPQDEEGMYDSEEQVPSL